MGEWIVPVIVAPAFFAFVALMVKFRLDFLREQRSAEGGGKSLGTGELQNLIQEATQDAMAPFEERLDLMEAQMRRLPNHDAESKHVEATFPDKSSED